MALLDLLKTTLIFTLINAAYTIYQWDKYDIQPAFSLHPSASFLSTEVSSTCECRHICETKYCCFAYSTRPNGTKLSCHLYRSFPKQSLSVLMPTSSGEIGSQIVPGWKRGEDGLFYKLLDKKFNSWEETKGACAALQMGARLALVKTLTTLNIIVEYAASTPNYVAIDMYKKNDTTFILGDGTILANTPLWKSNPEKIVTNQSRSVDIYIVTRGQIHDENRNQTLYAVCQANFLGIKY